MTNKEAIDKLQEMIDNHDQFVPTAQSWLIAGDEIEALRVINTLLQQRRQDQSKGGQARTPAKLAQLQQASGSAGRPLGSKDKKKRKTPQRKRSSSNEV